MNRFRAHLAAASMAASVGGALLPACAHNDSSMYIIGVVLPPTRQSQGQSCTYAAPSTGEALQTVGGLDVGLAAAYSPVVLIGNQTQSRQDTVQARTETDRIQVRGAIVRVTDSQGVQIANFTSLSEAVIDPSVGQSAGLAHAAITMVDRATIEGLKGQLPNRAARKTIVAYFRVYGQTLGGTYIESAEYQHVIETCNGCSVIFTQDAVDPKQPTPNCLAGFPAGSQVSGTSVALPCEMGQDQATDCRFCFGFEACDPTKLL